MEFLFVNYLVLTFGSFSVQSTSDAILDIQQLNADKMHNILQIFLLRGLDKCSLRIFVSSKSKLVAQEHLRALSVCHNKTEYNPLLLLLVGKRRNNHSP